MLTYLQLPNQDSPITDLGVLLRVRALGPLRHVAHAHVRVEVRAGKKRRQLTVI